MRVHTDDEIYRVDAVWLGPPRATFPWRARYIAWGVGIAVFLVVFSIARKVLNIDIGFFSVAWCLVITVAITRWIGTKINHERPLGGVIALWLAELDAPRQNHRARGSSAELTGLRCRAERPRPRSTATPAEHTADHSHAKEDR